MSYWARVRRHHRRRRRWQGLLQVALLIGGTFTLVIFCFFTGDADNHPNLRSSNSRSLLQASDASPTVFAEEVNVTVQKAAPLFPPSIFTEYQLRYQGAVIFYFLGMIYMFVALAIVCDEFFVPSLDVIIEKLQISEDVAGATFMAAGGSAPELFTSVIGVFISFDDVGIGTIVGSAVFNILFVIAMCVLFSKTVLDLTWWPIFRDITFYSVALILLVLFFMDGYIYWYEALCLFIIYILYCTFMKVNETVEKFVKRHMYKNKVTRVCSTDQLVPNHALPAAAMPVLPGMGRRTSVAPVIHGGTKFRQGLLQLMIHTIDPLHDGSGGNVASAPLGKVDEKATQLHAIASLKVLLDANKPENGRVETYRADGLSADTRPDTVSGRSSQGTEVTHVDSMMSSDVTSQGAPQTNGDVAADNNSLANNQPNVIHTGPPPYGNAIYPTRNLVSAVYEQNGRQARDVAAPLVPIQMKVRPAGSPGKWAVTTALSEDIDPTEDDDEPKPINLSWPDTTRKRIIYVIVAPIIFPLWITLPDSRSPKGKRFFFVTFIGSILWIAIFSYFMVWWANVLGETIKIPPEVMGLTVLAAGTSVPDLITSVIVARKGFGDMAVSSSIGSNIFDVCCGLPIPWLLYAFGQLIMNFVHGKENPWVVNPIQVSSGGMACSIMLLFSMLMFVLASIICSRWKMNKGLGISMFFLYFVFVGVSLSFEYDIIVCPV